VRTILGVVIPGIAIAISMFSPEERSPKTMLVDQDFRKILCWRKNRNGQRKTWTTTTNGEWAEEGPFQLSPSSPSPNPYLFTTTAMTDDNNKPYRHGHLIRLRGFNNPKMDGKLGRVLGTFREATSQNKIEFLDESVRPPVPFTPARILQLQPQYLQHACEHCLVASGALQMCGKCKTAHYCNSECQLADWARHKTTDCREFGHQRGLNKPLPLACCRGDISEVRRLVEVEEEDVDKATTGGPTPLVAAVIYNQLVVIRYLLEQGADKDKMNNNAEGATPLYIAAQKGHFAVMQCLVEQGADKDKAARDGLTPLCIAAYSGRFPMVRYLVEQGADKNKAAKEGFTPLYTAAQTGSFPIVRYLVEQGADINQATDQGATP
jgi:hypothetical protein